MSDQSVEPKIDPPYFGPVRYSVYPAAVYHLLAYDDQGWARIREINEPSPSGDFRVRLNLLRPIKGYEYSISLTAEECRYVWDAIAQFADASIRYEYKHRIRQKLDYAGWVPTPD